MVRSFMGLGQFRGYGSAANEGFGKLIDPLEVRVHLASIKNRSSPGPDGISKAMLSEWDPEGIKLAHMYSTWLVTAGIPKVFKKCRTTLIPKTGDVSLHGDVGQWRPITIASLVLRLYSRILTERMPVACPSHPRQRGFISSPGCSENLMLLNGCMNLSKQGKCSLAVVFIDFAKAFDTVSHEHLLSVLAQMGLDQHMVELVRDSYDGCETKVLCQEGSTPGIAMKVGVKQGDSMSPLLFNLALDPLIQQLEREGKSITAMAFADELVASAHARRILGLSRSKDEVVIWMTLNMIDPGKFERLWLSAGGSPDEVPELGPVLVEGSPAEGTTDTNSMLRPRKRLVPCDWRQVEFERWADQLIQGKRIRTFEEDKISNCWLLNTPPNKFSPSSFSAAVQLRANVYPTRELVGRGRSDTVDVKCRHCGEAPETCWHILGLCPRVRLCRIQRHHKVCQILVTEAERHGWEVEREKRWTLPSGVVLVPDLICWLDELALIVDVTVRYEFNEESLGRARIEKEDKYCPLIPVIRASRTQTQKVLVFGFPLGARGKWPAGNEQMLAELGLSKARTLSFAKLLSRRVLLYSLDIMRIFMRKGGE
ncbi:uncharacterized protein LOC119205528 [Pungitius pungitius]|uniref:uncharacterized protein LOC119205528 n=1 Tax=Pungitius pungitius TaxID=134920 RepID=UPI002E0FB1B3